MTDLQASLYALIGFGFYPLWLLGGALDYACHRRSAIERTAGARESLYHVAEFATIAVIVVGIAVFAGTLSLFVALVVSVTLHTVLAYMDVRFTERRRYISPLEQFAHALMDVAPIAAVALVIVLEWHSGAATWAIRLRNPMLEPIELMAILVPLLAAGVLSMEELVRTSRKGSRSNEHHIGFATIK